MSTDTGCKIRADIREATEEHDYPRSPGEIDMSRILHSLSLERNNVRFMAVTLMSSLHSVYVLDLFTLLFHVEMNMTKMN
jgi:hypothetical protein